MPWGLCDLLGGWHAPLALPPLPRNIWQHGIKTSPRERPREAAKKQRLSHLCPHAPISKSHSYFVQAPRFSLFSLLKARVPKTKPSEVARRGTESGPARGSSAAGGGSAAFHMGKCGAGAKKKNVAFCARNHAARTAGSDPSWRPRKAPREPGKVQREPLRSSALGCMASFPSFNRRKQNSKGNK